MNSLSAAAQFPEQFPAALPSCETAAQFHRAPTSLTSWSVRFAAPIRMLRWRRRLLRQKSDQTVVAVQLNAPILLRPNILVAEHTKSGKCVDEFVVLEASAEQTDASGVLMEELDQARLRLASAIGSAGHDRS